MGVVVKRPPVKEDLRTMTVPCVLYHDLFMYEVLLCNDHKTKSSGHRGVIHVLGILI